MPAGDVDVRVSARQLPRDGSAHPLTVHQDLDRNTRSRWRIG
jgi:hypothetical protein